MFTIEEIFTYGPAAPIETESDEAGLIAAAQLGDETAALRLIEAYGPALRASVSRFGKGHGASSGIEDLRQAALAAFMEVIYEHDPRLNPRLAGRVSVRLTSALADEVSANSAFRVPERTLSRFYGIVRAAEGDLNAALDLAEEYGMSRGVFQDVLAAVNAVSMDERNDYTDSRGGAAIGDPYSPVSGDSINASPLFSSTPIADVEDVILVDMAFGAVDNEEARICELAYGFTEYDPVPDAEIAHRLGLTRPTVQRKRGKALDKMRKAIGVTHA